MASYHAGFGALKRLLAEVRGVDQDELAEPLYAHWDRDAAEHLFAVAAGLDSMVLGETQIHAQVREAIRRASGEGAAGPTLTELFHAASRTGRRVRQETSLGAAPDAFVALGADLAAEATGGPRGLRAVVVGAGQMASLAVQHLRRRGVHDLRVLNRSLDHARVLAARTGAEAFDLTALPEALEDADVVASATGAAGHVLSHAQVARAMASRPSVPSCSWTSPCHAISTPRSPTSTASACSTSSPSAIGSTSTRRRRPPRSRRRTRWCRRRCVAGRSGGAAMRWRR